MKKKLHVQNIKPVKGRQYQIPYCHHTKLAEYTCKLF